jgi:transcriptional regulator with XRE-family HTH domain
MTGRIFDGGNAALQENVRAQREAHDLKKVDLSRMAHVSPAFLSNVESGKIKNPGVYSLYAVAVALGVRLEDLMGVQRVEATTKGRTTARRTAP